MHPNYLYRPQQAPLAPRWSKSRRGLLLSIYYPNGRKLALYQQGCGAGYFYLSVTHPAATSASAESEAAT